MATIKSSQDKITPCLWFDQNAAEAVKLYTSVFRKSKKIKVTYFGKNGPLPEGTVLTVLFEIEGQRFLALNGGPHFKFTEAVSFVINCKTQKEIDYYWNKLSKRGEIQQCGWLKDKFGLSWQVVPSNLGDMLTDKDSEKSSRVMQAILKMKKIDFEKLKKVYKGK